MKTKLFKRYTIIVLVLSLFMLLCISSSAAATDFELIYPAGTLVLDGSTDVSINLEFRIATDAAIRQLQVPFSTSSVGYNEDGLANDDSSNAYFTLTNLSGHEDMVDAKTGTFRVYTPAETGQSYGSLNIVWSYTKGVELAEDDAVFTATYLVKGDTPAGTYTITFPGLRTRLTTESSAVTSSYTATIVVEEAASTHTVTWQNYDGAELEKDTEVEDGTMPSYDGATPTKEGDAQYSYTFAGWSTDGSTVIDPLPAVTEDVTYIAVFEQVLNTYTVTWTIVEGASEAEIKAGVDAIIADIAPTLQASVNEMWGFMDHGNLLMIAADQYGLDGDVKSYVANRARAVLDNNDSYNTTADTYWDAAKSDIINQLSNAEHEDTHASLLSSTQKETLSGLSGSTTVLETDSNVAYGTAPSFDSATPTKTCDAQYSYTFAGWSTDGETVISSLPNVTGNVTYIAVFTKTVNTYTVQWVMGTPPADEATTKATVDTVIAEIAQKIYNDAKTEGDVIWDLGWKTHEELVSMHLAAGGVNTNGSENASTSYITKRIIEIVENGSADFSAADALWDSCKDSIASDFAKFTGYTSSDTGAVYSGLTAEQKATLEALNGSTTVLETDENVPYGTTPSYDGETPTKPGYTFTGWDPEITEVTGDATYVAQFTVKTATVVVAYVFEKGQGPANLSQEFTYAYGEELTDPEYEYCEFVDWADGTGKQYTSAEFKTYLDEQLESAASNPTIPINANFRRYTYAISLNWCILGTGEYPTTEEIHHSTTATNRLLGRAVQFSCEVERDGNAFKYWLIGQGEDYSTYKKYSNLRVAYFPTKPSDENNPYIAIACYGSEAEELDPVTFKVVNTTTEKIGNIYRAVITVDVTGPKGTEGGYTIQQAGIRYLAAGRAYNDEGELDTENIVLYETDSSINVPTSSILNLLQAQSGIIITDDNGLNDVNENGKAGFTFTARVPLKKQVTDVYAVAYIKYTVGDETVTKYATFQYGEEKADNATKYDTITIQSQIQGVS